MHKNRSAACAAEQGVSYKMEIYMLKKIILIAGLFLPLSSQAVTMTEAKIKEFNVYTEEGKALVALDITSKQYNVPSNCTDKYWLQLEGNTPERVYSAILAAYMAGIEVKVIVHSSACTSNGRPIILGVKFTR
jgi:hypothetical protein